MAEEDTQLVEMTANETQAVETTAQPAAVTVTVTKEEFEKMQSALKEANAEAAKRRKELDRVEAERKAKEEAEMTELDKAKKRAAELEAEISALQLNDKKRAIAAKVGLPPALALRLVGDNDDALETDAKAILESLPKQTAPNTGATNPGGSGKTTETDAQRRARLGF